MSDKLPTTINGLRSKIACRVAAMERQRIRAGFKGLHLDFRDAQRRIEVYEWVLRCLESLEVSRQLLLMQAQEPLEAFTEEELDAMIDEALASVGIPSRGRVESQALAFIGELRRALLRKSGKNDPPEEVAND